MPAGATLQETSPVRVRKERHVFAIGPRLSGQFWEKLSHKVCFAIITTVPPAGRDRADLPPLGGFYLR
ncbi:response regulator [Anopheles sinensis]|uniref:Response regulator n=1 Tax=Anopheles sinensis TaxID=74873 RepID=A0A084W8L3_ANOSI|nr:response regulator [Anopheles sinensis]